MLIVGTAGHIDHGKTSLVRALTGIDTDRLAEEKRRGISIELGFAHLILPGGTPISFIDVPGHERFIKNMLAGVGGIGAVLLVVAADEGVKPQTREHFEICRLLQIPLGIVALTKIDAATPEQAAAAKHGLAALLKGSFLECAPVIPVSATAGIGLVKLKDALMAVASQQSRRRTHQFARLNVDRVFAAKGFGTIATGTLLEGQLRPGDTVQLHPAKKAARIRSLQVHGREVAAAVAGERTAVNLTGVEHSEIERGHVLTHANELASTSVMDVSVEWLDEASEPTRRQQFLLHVGTAEIPVSLKTIAHGYARVWLDNSTLVFPGDRFILRRPSPAATVGGGTVLDPFPPVRLSRVKSHARLALWNTSEWPQRLELLVSEAAHGRTMGELSQRTGFAPDVLREHIAHHRGLLLAEGAQRVLSLAWLETKRSRLVEWLRDFHKRNPAIAGAPVAKARLDLEAPLAAVVLADFPAIRVTGDTVSLATFQPQSNPDTLRLLTEIEGAFRRAGLQPASPATLLQEAGTDGQKGRPYMEALIKARRLIRVSDDIVFHADAIAQVRRSLGTQKGRKFSIPEFKEWTQVSRKYAVPLLEYLDRQHVTRREGDSRVIL